uniref:Polycystic kidney disease 1b n=1 Tax=Hucho hucho TaxID=62062 RepID=A0A4W5JPQ4_9TELE
MQFVSIHTEKQAYATNTDITFRARTEEPDPLEFLWHFGDSQPLRTTSRSFKKTYHTPDRYSVVVVVSNGLSSFTSEVHPVLVQRAVRPNRLLLQPSVVLNHTASFTCRVNSGTNLSYSWNFGDGTSRTGGNTEQHVFHRTGEFTVEVTVSNLVSSASLTAQMFVVDRPCKPPAVKNMGPLTPNSLSSPLLSSPLLSSPLLSSPLQVRRYEPVGLGVTYEAEVQCDVFQGLEYNWSLYTSTGLPVPLPPVHTDRQSITLPSHFLHYGIYTAIARVQIVGSVVYSNYSVCVEVVPSPLVSFIHGGTNVFLSSRNSSVISLNGQLSYDPDYPMNHLRYYSWTCKPISAIDSSCFDQYVPTSFSVVVFPVGFLKRDFDQFRFTLTVQSGERSSTADTFITVTPSLVRVSMYCYQCQGDAVNWDQSFSVRAVCESCGPSPRTISYTWTLYLVDSSSKVETTSFVALKYVGVYFKVYFISDLGGFDPGGPPYPISEYPVVTFDDGSILYSAPLGQSDIIEEFPIDPDFPTDYDFPFPVLESGDVSGRPGVDGGSSESSEGDSAPAVPGSGEDKGSNLMDSGPSLVVLDPTLLDLPRELLEQELFESYTYTGISSALITFRPFTLRAGSRYMLEVTANSHDAVLGRTQLFLSTSPSPRGITCQVQPSSGLEIHTHFSIFCTSGKEDLLYEYSFSIGNSPPKILYQGRDFQYYFNLPSGDPQDDYKATIYTEVRNRFGAATTPCPVTVTVHPSFIRNTSSNYNPDRELFESCLRNLSGLVLLGNSVEIRNYIILLSSVLNRLSQDPTANTHTQTQTRTALINAVCQLDINDQVHTLARTHAHTDAHSNGPVIDLTLYNCSTRKEIPVRSNISSLSEFTLLRSQVNYHGFNITQQALQEAILVIVEFTRPPNKTFPIMLLFRMFERPTPSLYHIHSIYHWDRNTTYITLPPSYLTGYLPSDVTVVCVCVVCVCLYALGMVVCKRADLISERNQGVYYLSDNAPSDTHLYSVTIHTGLRSSPSMTAKVHVVLYGEDGVSQTRQLHDPECPLFRRNSRNTFILSTVDSLGPLWGLHLWHDNTGPSPTWYLRQVEVCEVKGKGWSWLFLGQCWLAVDEGDGQVERRLRVCDQGPGFTKLLYLKLSEYMSDFHLWLSVYSGPSPSVFTHTQRLSVCLLLLLGYMCVNTLLISGLDDQYTSELGIIDVSAVSLTTGLLSALAVLPVATALSFLFRQREVRVIRSEVKQDMVRLPDIYSIEGRTHTHTCKALLFLCACVCMCVWCVCAYVRFSSSKTLLWIHSLFFSLLSCVFLIQPAMVLAARQRARYLRLVRPPTSGELRRTGGRKRRETLIHKTLRLCVSMLFLLLCVTYGSSSRDQYHLNHAVRTQFTSPHNPFLSIQTHEEWWNWTLTSVLDGLYWDTWYNNISATGKVCVCVCVCVSEFVSRLESLRSAGWLDKLTVAMATQFTLYSPPTNLFNSVNLMAERLPGGALHTSARIQSARVYHSPTAWDYFSMACQLLFLLVSLFQLVLQICSASILLVTLLSVSLQVSILLVTLVYYVYYIYQSILTLEVVDLLQRHDFRMHVDVSLLSTWEQHTCTLRGILIFLLVVRCMCLSGVNRTMAASVTLLRLAFSRLLWPMVSGVVLLVALSSVGNLLLLRRSWGFSSLPHSVFTLLSLSRGRLGSRAPSLSMASQPHKLHSPNSLTTLWFRLRYWLIYIFSPQTFYLEEFESLVDELQFRLNAFSNSLHHTLPPKDLFSPTQSPSSLASQVGKSGSHPHCLNQPTSVYMI